METDHLKGRRPAIVFGTTLDLDGCAELVTGGRRKFECWPGGRVSSSFVGRTPRCDGYGKIPFTSGWFGRHQKSSNGRLGGTIVVVTTAFLPLLLSAMAVRATVLATTATRASFVALL
jgi:hypothetical protein